jgi:3-oxoacyl-[acyl-carrier protein] reductase
MKLLEGKVAIITGASRGIGSGIAKVFAQHGANVAFTYSSSAESALVLENELNALGIKAKGYKSNAADFNEAQKLADDVLAEFGTIDILINNAGITKDNLLMRMSEEDFDKVIEINLKSVFNMTKAVQKNHAEKPQRFYRKHEFGCWCKRKCRTSQLRRFKSRNDWFY